ncbi:MAG: hypothetical protein WC873_02800 [Candidatus Gracilibacteria bacterium]
MILAVCVKVSGSTFFIEEMLSLAKLSDISCVPANMHSKSMNAVIPILAYFRKTGI